MTKFKTILLCLVVGIAIQVSSQSKKPVYTDNSQPIEKRVEDALSRMTLEEKVKLCTAQSKFSTHGVPRLGIPELWMSDGPHGVRMEILWDSWDHANWTNDSCTAFPALTCLAATWDPAMSHLYGNAVGEEARYRRKDVLLGPGVNIYRSPLNGRNFEYLGEDPYLAGRMVIPYIQGVQENGVSACVKHFALNNQERWRDRIDVQISDRALYEIYLPAFKAAVTEAKVWSIMGSYNKIRGQYACENELTLNKILKGEWKFDGCVITDWGGAHNTKEAALNGLDIEMGTWTNGFTFSKSNAYESYFLANPYLKMLKSGEIPVSNVDEKAARILRLIFRTAMNVNKPYGSLASEEHHMVGRTVAEQGIVLLKNTANLLPIDASKYKTIAVIGENANRRLTEGGGSSELKPKREVSALQALTEKFGDNKIKYAMGYGSGAVSYDMVNKSPYDEAALRKEAVELASKSDIVIFVGGLNKNTQQDSEGDDRRSYGLPFGQNELIAELQKANKNIVLVMLSGNGYEMPWLKQATTLVQGWYGGSEAGHAIANVIAGEVNPSGKLPFTFAAKLNDYGAHSFGAIAFPGDSIKEEYKEDILVGYRWFDTKKIKPLFPFGFGLSYTTFEYGKIAADKKQYAAGETIKLSFTLKNTGKVDGAEAVQVYASQPKSSMVRPAKELKAFKKVFLKAGETQTVELEVKANDLAFYNDKNHSWSLEPGEFILRNASSSADVKSSVSIQVK
ncbi:MAG: glycoside hydrolase family 3 C-terminal domain-containing protein [Paludibacter sp.]|nr:glycoside hydrolase family 3 C-terminal domain-containing protein [Paludibacter sp.]